MHKDNMAYILEYLGLINLRLLSGSKKSKGLPNGSLAVPLSAASMPISVDSESELLPTSMSLQVPLPSDPG